ncbi:MAG TPA: hypothetical protein VHM19_09680 [Polyangiales bacterium]|nr:hypothetical protein [Polyangiales bacterium]
MSDHTADHTQDHDFDHGHADAASAGEDAGPVGTPITVHLDAMVAKRALACGTTYMLGIDATPAKLVDFDFTAANVAALDGTFVEHPVVVNGSSVLDYSDGTHGCAGDAATHSELQVSSPGFETYGYALRIKDFYLALDVGAAKPYIVKLSTADGTDAHFHLFDPSKERIVIDLDDLLAFVDLGADQGGAFGCDSDTSDPECQAIYPQLGVDSTGQSVHHTPPAFHTEPL